MTKLLLATTAAALVAGAAAVTGCGSDKNSSSTPPKRDSLGAAFITDAQGKAIRKGMSARAAFRKLGGKPESSTGEGPEAGPVLGYQFPIRGTGNPGNPNRDQPSYATYWQICIGRGRVLSKRRGTIENLPASCPENFPIVNPNRNLRCLYDSPNGGTSANWLLFFGHQEIRLWPLEHTLRGLRSSRYLPRRGSARRGRVPAGMRSRGVLGRAQPPLH
jgi:hypothetical protein